MKKFISLILALVLATTFGVSAFANEITPMRYDPCAYCGNPIFEKTIYGNWIDTGTTRPTPGGFAGQYDKQQFRNVKVYWECGTCHEQTRAHVYKDYRWVPM